MIIQMAIAPIAHSLPSHPSHSVQLRPNYQKDNSIIASIAILEEMVVIVMVVTTGVNAFPA